MRIGRIVTVTGASALLLGCYTLQPAGSANLAPGTRVAFDVTDVGRVALGGAMGPEISQIEGRFIQRDSLDYIIGVRSVSLLRGGTQVWTGERVRLKPEYVANAYESRLNKPQTALAIAAGVGLFAYATTRGLLGSNSSSQDERHVDSAITQRFPGRGHTAVLPLLSFPLHHLIRP